MMKKNMIAKSNNKGGGGEEENCKRGKMVYLNHAHSIP